jgi:AraC-like DNA-binding protein
VAAKPLSFGDNVVFILENKYLNTTTHAGVAHMMGQALASYGIDPAEIFTRAGLDANAGQNTDQRLLATAMQKAWRIAVEVTGDEGFGLRCAQQLHPASLQGLGFACVVSNTLYDAFVRLVRYYRVITTAGEIILEEQEDRLRLLYRVPGQRGAAAPASLDAALAFFLQLCRLTKDDSFRPVLVELQRPISTETGSFDTYFGCPIVYDTDENSLYFDRNDLNTPLPMANPELARANDKVIIDYLKRNDDDDVVSKVRSSIIDWLPSGAPSQESIAQSLNTSPRTLQRKLSASGQTFSGLLETIRSELAQQYLSVPGKSVSEVAYLLGFSEPGNFTRSFKRWTGRTPIQFQSSSTQ